MSTKNISRTIIEGGRATRNQEDRWLSNQHHRAQNRQFSKNIKSLVDADDAGVMPKRKHVGKDFSDKLSPAYRWLRAQVGRPWNKVLSELTTRFDTRTTAGRHIIYDHLLGDVCTNLTDAKFQDNWRWFDFYVDAKGILQLSERNRWSKGRGRSHRLGPDYPSAKEIQDWAQGRRVMDFGVSLFWYKPEEKAWKECDGYSLFMRCQNHHRPGTKLVRVESRSVLAFERNSLYQEKNEDGTVTYYREVKTKECLQGIGNYVQDKRFSKKDIEMWNRLHEYDRERLLWLLPKSARKGKNQWRKRL